MLVGAVSALKARRSSIMADRWAMIPALAIIVLAFLLRLYQLPQGVDLEETDQFGYLLVAENFSRHWIPTLYEGKGEFQAGFLFQLTGYGIGLLAGGTRIGMQLVSMASAMAITALLFFYGRWLGRPRLGLIAAAIFALNPLSVYYSRQPMIDVMASFSIFVWFWCTQLAAKSGSGRSAFLAGLAMGVAVLAKWYLVVVFCAALAALLLGRLLWLLVRARLYPAKRSAPISLLPASWKPVKKRPFLLGMAILVVPPHLSFFLSEPARYTYVMTKIIAHMVPFVGFIVAAVVNALLPILSPVLSSDELTKIPAGLAVFSRGTNLTWLENLGKLRDSVVLWYLYRTPLHFGWPGLFLLASGLVAILPKWRSSLPLLGFYVVLAFPFLFSTFPRAAYVLWFMPIVALVSAAGLEPIIRWSSRQTALASKVALFFAGVVVVGWMSTITYAAWSAHVEQGLAAQLRNYLRVERGLKPEADVVLADWWPSAVSQITGLRTAWLSIGEGDLTVEARRNPLPVDVMQHLHDFGGVVLLTPFGKEYVLYEFRGIPYDYLRQRFRPETRLQQTRSAFPQGYGTREEYFDVYVISPNEWNMLERMP